MSKEIKNILKKGKKESAHELDKKEMFALFHQQENEYALKGVLLEALNETEVAEIDKYDYEALFADIWTQIESRKIPAKTKTRTLVKLARIAAVFVVGISLGFFIYFLQSNSTPEYYTAYSPSGSVSEMMLPDSSIIFLNAGSKIKYSINGDKGVREVFLTGEAWFDVHENKKKPFLVHTPFYDVNVTGTQFNIKAYGSENMITTTLESGRIEVKATEKCKLSNTIVLNPGEQLTLNGETKKMVLKTVNPKRFSSWKENKLIFVNMSLKDLIVLLERKFGVDIEVKDDALLDLHFDGTIKNQTIVEIMEIIRKTLPIDYEIVEQKIEISTKKL